MTTDPHVLSDGHAPTPYTAAEIRAGCPEGRTVLYVTDDADGETVRANRFTAVDDEGATLVSEDGDRRVTWLELQGHASFPERSTTIEEEVVTTPLGSLVCVRYRVISGEETQTFWFDRGRPGMPVQYTAEQAGKVTSTTTMVSDQIV